MKTLLKAKEVEETVEKMAEEVLKTSPSPVIIGIRSRGVPLARRLSSLIQRKTRKTIPVGELDITLYRDDLSRQTDQPVVKKTEINFSINDAVVWLVDDVLYTGRTIRCALDALFDFGRPRAVKLAVLVDRGGRELPVQADVVGHAVKAQTRDNVQVRLREIDGKDEVVLESVKFKVQSEK